MNRKVRLDPALVRKLILAGKIANLSRVVGKPIKEIKHLSDTWESQLRLTPAQLEELWAGPNKTSGLWGGDIAKEQTVWAWGNRRVKSYSVLAEPEEHETGIPLAWYRGQEMLVELRRSAKSMPAYGSPTIQQLEYLSTNKYPVTLEPHVGVEIEFCVPSWNYHQMKCALARIPMVQLGGDGSLRPPPEWSSHEVKIVAPEDKIVGRIKLVCRALREAGSAVNQSCGLHVHLDARPVGEDREARAKQIWSRIIRAEKMLMQMQPGSRRVNEFCRRSKIRVWERASRSRGDRHDRYKAVNALAFHKYQTIEIRCHTGTVKAEKIIGWVNLLLAISKSDAKCRPAMRYLRELGLDLATIGYVKTRIQRWGTGHWSRRFGGRNNASEPVREELIPREYIDQTAV